MSLKENILSYRKHHGFKICSEAVATAEASKGWEQQGVFQLHGKIVTCTPPLSSWRKMRRHAYLGYWLTPHLHGSCGSHKKFRLASEGEWGMRRSVENVSSLPNSGVSLSGSLRHVRSLWGLLARVGRHRRTDALMRRLCVTSNAPEVSRCDGRCPEFLHRDCQKSLSEEEAHSVSPNNIAVCNRLSFACKDTSSFSAGAFASLTACAVSLSCSSCCRRSSIFCAFSRHANSFSWADINCCATKLARSSCSRLLPRGPVQSLSPRLSLAYIAW